MIEHKSEKIQQTALENGWKAQLIPDIPLNGNIEEIVWNLYCVREEEKIHVQYIGNRLSEATYTLGDYSSYPQYRNNVLKLLTNRPSVKRVQSAGIDIEETRSVPWVSDDPAFLILQEVLGREITWIRKLDGVVCTGVVDARSNTGSKYFRIYERNGIRFLEWTDEEGFHTVRLDSIIRVS